MSKQFIFQMSRMTKILPNGKTLLQDINLSFYPGAKIGIIGENGFGKSTVLRIMAGVDEEFEGRTWKDPTATVGYLAQEPELDEDLTVRENIEQGLANLRALLDEYDAVNERFAEEMTDEEMDKLIIKQGELQDKIDASNAWEIDRMVDVAMEALRVPDPDSAVTHLSGGERRRVALCRLLLAKPPTFCCLTNPPTIWMPTALLG